MTVEQERLKKLEDNYRATKDDIIEQASIVQDLGDSRSARVPWLERTAFLSQLANLKDEEIKGSFKLPSKKTAIAKGTIAKASKGGGKGKGKDRDDADGGLRRILDAAEAVFQDVYRLCSDTSPNCKMT